MTFLTSSFQLDCRSLATTGCERETHRPVYARSMSVEERTLRHAERRRRREPDRAASADAPRALLPDARLAPRRRGSHQETLLRTWRGLARSRAAGPFGPGSSRSRRTSASTRSEASKRVLPSTAATSSAPRRQAVWASGRGHLARAASRRVRRGRGRYEAPDAREGGASRSRSSQRCSTAALQRGPHPARCSASAREVAGRWRRAQRR